MRSRFSGREQEEPTTSTRDVSNLSNPPPLFKVMFSVDEFIQVAKEKYGYKALGKLIWHEHDLDRYSDCY